MDQRRKVTIYDIAQRSGASASTVASVLNGSWRRRRIKAETADHVSRVAKELGYRANRQASSLRTQRSGLIGLVLPIHDNRYFSSLSQRFEAEARRRKLCPVIVSTLRDPLEEKRTVSTLLSHSVDQLFMAGATDPDPLAKMCVEAGVPHINLDLPGTRCASVISDNYWGTAELTRYLLRHPRNVSDGKAHDSFFVGGISTDHNTRERMQAFRDVVQEETGLLPEAAQVDPCGYSPEAGEAAVRRLHERLGRLPSLLLVNSTISFEGVFRFLKQLPDRAFEHTVLGCYDWDPFLSYLHFPVAMVRQDAYAIVDKAFEVVDSGRWHVPEVTLVRPELVLE